MEPRTTPFTDAGDLVRWIDIPGTGEPVVFVHGLGCDGAASWADAAVRLGRRAVIMDLPGHGRSDRPATFDYTLPSLAGAVARVIEAVSGTAVDVVSHSLGGSAAIVLAATRPELVRRSVLVEPGIDPRSIEPGDLAAYPEADLLTGGWAELLAKEAPWRRADMRLADPLAVVRSARHISEGLGGTLARLLADSSAPTTLVRSPFREYDSMGTFAPFLARDVVVPEAGHFVMLDQPEGFATILINALSDEPEAGLGRDARVQATGQVARRY
jgi:pimeloyl-ACP methyl ester carboxylesterase